MVVFPPARCRRSCGHSGSQSPRARACVRAGKCSSPITLRERACMSAVLCAYRWFVCCPVPRARGAAFCQASKGVALAFSTSRASQTVAPAFAFGHGLTYTSFELDNLTVSSEMVSCHVRNSGERDGVETLQLYLGLPAEAKAPPLQLKGFAKVKLNPGERKPVHFPLTTRSRSTWDAAVHAWREVSGRVEVVVGTSSRDEAALTGHFNVS